MLYEEDQHYGRTSLGINATLTRLAPLPPLPRQKLPALPELSEIKYSKSPPVLNSKY